MFHFIILSLNFIYTIINKQKDCGKSRRNRNEKLTVFNKTQDKRHYDKIFNNIYKYLFLFIYRLIFIKMIDERNIRIRIQSYNDAWVCNWFYPLEIYPQHLNKNLTRTEDLFKLLQKQVTKSIIKYNKTIFIFPTAITQRACDVA